jgi:hypothetical protein
LACSIASSACRSAYSRPIRVGQSVNNCLLVGGPPLLGPQRWFARSRSPARLVRRGAWLRRIVV